jgi:flagellar hook-associated protein 1 FlgK
VRIGGSSGPVLVSGGNAASLAMTVAGDGTLAFDVGGTAVTLGGGSLAGHALALREVVDVRARLDTLAEDIATLVNGSQAAGAALDGSAGQPLFTGTTALSLRIAFTDGALIATAPLGSPAASRNATTLVALRSALETGGTAEQMNSILFDVSSRVAGHEITTVALDAIASSARISLTQQAGVDLDTEAANLLRYQQAFQASARAMQAASDIFDTLIAIG